MLTYLLNATLVWLLSALLYEAFFRKETVHRWNRAYLVITLALGFLLPLIRWEHPERAVASAMRLPLRRIVVAKETALLPAGIPGATTAQASAQPPLPPDWLLIAYCAGAALSLVLLARAGRQLFRLYAGGRRQRQGALLLVQTGRQHGPFSFFHCVFLSDAGQYSREELALVLQHEGRHARLLHSLDALMLQLLRCLLWFHPLIYWYNLRLRLIHEYQADAAASHSGLPAYGRFLLSQALQSPVPSFAHAFFHSPLKARIRMLTRTQSSGLRLGRYLLVLPLLSVVSLCCTRQSVAPRQAQIFETDTVIYFHGRRIEMGELPAMKLQFSTDSGAAQNVVFSLGRVPVKVGQETVYYEEQLEQQPRFAGTGTASEALFEQLRPLLNELEDGYYTMGISNVVVDGAGQLAYYEVSGLALYTPFRCIDAKSAAGAVTFIDPATDPGRMQSPVLPAGGAATQELKINGESVQFQIEEVPEAATYAAIGERSILESEQVNLPRKQAIDAAAEELLAADAIRFRPATRNGLPVVAGLDSDLDLQFAKYIRVTNHKAVLEDNPDYGKN